MKMKDLLLRKQVVVDVAGDLSEDQEVVDLEQIPALEDQEEVVLIVVTIVVKEAIMQGTVENHPEEIHATGEMDHESLLMMVVVLFVMKRVIRKLTAPNEEKGEEVATGVVDTEEEEDPAQEVHLLYVEELDQEVDLKEENSK